MKDRVAGPAGAGTRREARRLVKGRARVGTRDRGSGGATYTEGEGCSGYRSMNTSDSQGT
jgi:hypothetical protein